MYSFAVNFSVPYMLAALGSKVGFIFGSVAFLSFIFTYFCVPECAGKTLEEVNELFNHGVAIKDFGKADVTSMTRAQIAGDVEKHSDAEMATDVEKSGHTERTSLARQ